MRPGKEKTRRLRGTGGLEKELFKGIANIHAKLVPSYSIYKFIV